MAFELKSEPIPRGLRSTVHRPNGPPLAWRDVAAGWREDGALRDVFLDHLAAAPFDAFFWETAPSSAATCERPFEQVVVESTALTGVRPDGAPFAEKLAGERDVVAFANLGGDARLVVPASRGDDAPCAHLADFVRGAPREQAHALLSRVGVELERWWSESDAPVWLSTSGLGVFWVHVRLDRRPKYYTYAPYRRFA